MKFSKFFSFIIIITALSLFYVREQVALLELGYDISKREKKYISLLDQNNQLRYNTFALCGPKQLEKGTGFSKNNFIILENKHILKAEGAPKTYREAHKNYAFSKFIGKISDIFTLRTQAEAKTITK